MVLVIILISYFVKYFFYLLGLVICIVFNSFLIYLCLVGFNKGRVVRYFCMGCILFVKLFFNIIWMFLVEVVIFVVIFSLCLKEFKVNFVIGWYKLEVFVVWYFVLFFIILNWKLYKELSCFLMCLFLDNLFLVCFVLLFFFFFIG